MRIFPISFVVPRAKRVLPPALVLLFSCAAAAQSLAPANPTLYLDDVKALTAPAMEGRGDGTKGLTRASHLLEQHYRKLGLKPAGKNGYFQPFTVITGAQLKSGGNHVSVQESSGKRELKLNQDFVPFSFSSSGSANAPVV